MLKQIRQLHMTCAGQQVSRLFVRGDVASGYHADERAKLHSELSGRLKRDVKVCMSCAYLLYPRCGLNVIQW